MTMLSLHPQGASYLPPHPASVYALPAADLASFIAASSSSSPGALLHHAHAASVMGKPDPAEPPAADHDKRRTAHEAAVAQALEIARESPDGEQDPTVAGILEAALAAAWARVAAAPESYVMTPGEFAVFNFFQHRFAGDRLAVAARRRYWDNTHA